MKKICPPEALVNTITPPEPLVKLMIWDCEADRAKFVGIDDCDVLVFGHSHIPYNQEHNGQLLFNPGSATDRRRQPRCSLGLLHIDDETHEVRGEIIWL